MDLLPPTQVLDESFMFIALFVSHLIASQYFVLINKIQNGQNRRWRCMRMVVMEFSQNFTMKLLHSNFTTASKSTPTRATKQILVLWNIPWQSSPSLAILIKSSWLSSKFADCQLPSPSPGRRWFACSSLSNTISQDTTFPLSITCCELNFLQVNWIRLLFALLTARHSVSLSLAVVPGHKPCHDELT